MQCADNASKRETNFFAVLFLFCTISRVATIVSINDKIGIENTFLIFFGIAQYFFQ
jgi:hypothetical protein